MKFNVSEVDNRYDFVIEGTSYIGTPKDGTCLFVTKKIKNMISTLQGHKNCLVYVEDGVDVPAEFGRENCIVVTDNPQKEYGAVAYKLKSIEQQERMNWKYDLCSGGYYIGQNVHLGNDIIIEPGCLIDHGVSIGDHSRIGFGSIIRNAVIGSHFCCYEYSVIGTESYNVGEGIERKYRLPSFGKVIIGEYVDLGAHVVIERGFNSDTIIKDNVLVDSDVMIGHDVIIEDGAEITCGVCLAGRVTLGRNTFVGMNSSIRQRVNVGEGSVIGMGASVITNVKPGVTVFGNPAKAFFQ